MMNAIQPFGSTAVTTTRPDPFNALPGGRQKYQQPGINQPSMPKWYSELSKLGQTASGQTKDQWNSYYGGYTGGPVLQSLQDAAVKAYTVRNPEIPTGLVGSAIQQYINNGVAGNQTGNLNSMFNGRSRRDLGMNWK